jgi:hypothetical protein
MPLERRRACHEPVLHEPGLIDRVDKVRVLTDEFISDDSRVLWVVIERFLHDSLHFNRRNWRSMDCERA